MSWRDSAACREVDPEIFFVDYGWVGRPPGTLKKQREAALAVCQPCPVKVECLEDALAAPATRDYGVWGGTTRYQRVALRQTRNRSSVVLVGSVRNG